MQVLDQSVGQERCSGALQAGVSEHFRVGDHWSWHWQARIYACEAEEIPFHEPIDVIDVPTNMLVTGGIALLLDLLGGLGGTPYSSGNAYLYVGTSTTAAASGQSDLLGTTAEAAMDAGYPQRSGTTLTWQATFGTSVGNIRWEEFAIKNGAGAVSDTVRILNRRVDFILEKSSSVSVVFSATLVIT